jgi:hypothetical protein
MNCHDLEGTVHDLARGQMMDASLREKALSHIESCGCCSVRLADERSLTAGLRHVAATAEEAPARVETALLAEFREQRKAVPATAVSVTLPPGRRWLYAAAGIAAIALIVVLLALVTSRTHDSQERAPQQADTKSAPAPAVTPVTHERLQPNKPEASLEGSRKNSEPVRPSRRGLSNGADRLDKKPGSSNEAPDDLNRLTAEAEIATDFIPLMGRESLAQLDGGQVMRVELPRSALMSFGLPMDMERATERIKADVVVGYDGLARAIRFVR